jgi:DNA-binding SARP family transcriptional activator
MLWPEADITAGLNNFNQSVFQLRRELDPAHRDGETAPYVVSTVESVYLHPDLVRADLGDIRRLTARLSMTPLALKRETAEKLLSLVRGEFLFDLRYEDWTPPLQLRVHAEVRSYLAPLLIADGIEIRHETGVRAALAVIGLDEYDEMAQFALIRQLAASGKREAARAAATRYISRLRNELNEEPGPELADLLATVGRR